jgi:hypothetical protein
VILRSCCGCMCMYECFALIITGAALAGGCLCAGAMIFSLSRCEARPSGIGFLGFFRFSRRACGHAARRQGRWGITLRKKW